MTAKDYIVLVQETVACQGHRGVDNFQAAFKMASDHLHEKSTFLDGKAQADHDFSIAAELHALLARAFHVGACFVYMDENAEKAYFALIKKFFEIDEMVSKPTTAQNP